MGLKPGPFIWSPKVDFGVFLLPTLVGFGIVGGRALFFPFEGGHLPDWAWIALVLGVDVAHVWATLFRTYFDGEELRRRAALYVGAPVLCFATGTLLHMRSGLTFWRVLAYLAVFHFIRQQTGWAAIYRARAGGATPADRLIDNAVIYLGTGVPLLAWHTRLPRPFAWFLDGDFLDLRALAPVLPVAQAALAGMLVVFAVRHAARARRTGVLELGKLCVVVTTVVSWYVAIVVAEDDFTFTVLNVLPHGVPYVALLFAYSQSRAKLAPAALASRIVTRGVLPFLLTLLVFAFAEEALWDRLVWHDRGRFFGFLPEFQGKQFQAWLVPLLSLPQSTHYVLDAVLWRRKDTGREQASALGFAAQ